MKTKRTKIEFIDDCLKKYQKHYETWEDRKQFFEKLRKQAENGNMEVKAFLAGFELGEIETRIAICSNFRQSFGLGYGFVKGKVSI